MYFSKEDRGDFLNMSHMDNGEIDHSAPATDPRVIEALDDYFAKVDSNDDATTKGDNL